MPTQFMMAILFCTCDGILNFQNIYYKYCTPPRHLKAQQQLDRSHQQVDQQLEQQAEESEVAALLEPAGLGNTTLASLSGSNAEMSPAKLDSTSFPPAHKLRSLSAGGHNTFTTACSVSIACHQDFVMQAGVSCSTICCSPAA